MTQLTLFQINWINKAYAQLVKSILSTIVKRTFMVTNVILLKTTLKGLKAALLFLNKHTLCCYKQLVDIAAEDTPKYPHRFRINYILSSVLYNHKILLSVTANEILYLPSVSDIFSSACWLEREVWDLYGIFFEDNLDLRRILTDYGFLGHPLRKDFPLSGFSEIYYSLEKKRILTEPIELAQEYRVFSL